MSRTFHHISTARAKALATLERQIGKPAARKPSAVREHQEAILICEHGQCNRPGLLVLLPGLTDLEAPCYCMEHARLIA
jgi:hypothetical protein